MFQSIVVAMDGSDPSFRALNAACVLAKALGSELHLVHATDTDAEAGHGNQTSEVLARATADAEASGVNPSSATAVQGDPFEEIMTIVGLYGADLIVTGRRGLGGISGMFAGSTSRQIAKSSDCAHLSVK